jgi:Helix-turn-helix domain
MMSAIEEAHPFMAYQSTRPNHSAARAEFLAAINEAHTRSGLSLREIAQVCDLDHTYLHLILQGKRHPHRDVLISLCTFGWHLDPIETDTILMADGHPPLGRSVRREYSASGANQASVSGTSQSRSSD